MIEACRAYLGQLALHRGWQLRIASERLTQDVDVGSNPISEQQFRRLLRKAEREYEREETFDFDGVAIPGLTGMRWWELAVLCLIVVGGAKPRQVGVGVQFSSSDTEEKTALRSRYSAIVMARWQAIALRVCCIMSSDSRVPNGPPKRYENIGGRECVCIRPPLIRHDNDLPAPIQMIAAEGINMAKLHLQTVESINSIRIPLLLKNDAQSEERVESDTRADYLHGSHAAECAAHFALRFQLRPVREIPPKELLEALHDVITAIPRFTRGRQFPPINTYAGVLGMAADVARERGSDPLSFLRPKHHFTSMRSPDFSRWEELQAGVDDLTYRVGAQLTLSKEESERTNEVRSPEKNVIKQTHVNIDHGVLRPLTPRSMAVLKLLRSQPSGTGLTGIQIIKLLKEEPYRIAIGQGALTRDVMPKLKKYFGVVNERGVGYYIASVTPASALQ